MNSPDILTEISAGESKTLEFKETIPPGDKIAQTVIAFSNKAGGKIVIGVTNTGEISGVPEADIAHLKDALTSMIWDSCTPPVNWDIITENVQGKMLLIIRVYPGKLKPYYIKSKGLDEGTYIRIGATNRKAEKTNITELERERENISYDSEIDHTVIIDSLDITFLKNILSIKGKDLTNDKLVNLGLIKDENGKRYATRGLVILCGLYENTVTKCARFKGIDKTLFIDNKEYSGNLFSQIDAIEQFLQNHLNTRSDFNSFQREDVWELPFLALREAIINAFVHRDYYNLGRDIKIAVYDNRVEIVSPGALPNTLTIHELYQGRSEIRNRVLAILFKECGYIEQWGSGIERMIQSCRKYSLKDPLIEETGDSVAVTFYRKTDTNAPAESGIDRRNTVGIPSELLTTQEHVIISYLNTKGKITSKVIETILNIKESRSREILKEMVSKNMIQKKGGSKNTYYIVNKNYKSDNS